MANVFQNIGKGVSDIAGAGLGALGAVDQAIRPAFYENQELKRKLQILQQMDPSQPAFAKFSRAIMDQHGPEIMKNLPQGAYQGQQETTGKPPWWTDPAMREKFPEETGIAGGTMPRAVDPFIQLGRMAEAESNLGVDPLTAKPRFPGLTNKINRRINEFQLPGTKEEQSPAERKSLLWPVTEGPPYSALRPAPPGPVRQPTAATKGSKGLLGFNLNDTVAGSESALPLQDKALPKAPDDSTSSDFAIWQSVRGKWYRLPAKLREEIRAALSETNPKTGKKYTWSEIASDEVVQAELAKVK